MNKGDTVVHKNLTRVGKVDSKVKTVKGWKFVVIWSDGVEQLLDKRDIELKSDLEARVCR